MKILRLILTGFIVLLFSGVLTPVTAASATDAAGLQYDVYNNILKNGGDGKVQRSTTAYPKCGDTRVASNIDFNVGSGTVVSGCGFDRILIHYYGYISSSTSSTKYFRAWADDGFWM